MKNRALLKKIQETSELIEKAKFAHSIDFTIVRKYRLKDFELNEKIEDIFRQARLLVEYFVVFGEKYLAETSTSIKESKKYQNSANMIQEMREYLESNSFYIGYNHFFIDEKESVLSKAYCKLEKDLQILRGYLGTYTKELIKENEDYLDNLLAPNKVERETELDLFFESIDTSDLNLSKSEYNFCVYTIEKNNYTINFESCSTVIRLKIHSKNPSSTSSINLTRSFVYDGLFKFIQMIKAANSTTELKFLLRFCDKSNPLTKFIDLI